MWVCFLFTFFIVIFHNVFIICHILFVLLGFNPFRRRQVNVRVSVCIDFYNFLYLFIFILIQLNIFWRFNSLN